MTTKTALLAQKLPFNMLKSQNQCYHAIAWHTHVSVTRLGSFRAPVRARRRHRHTYPGHILPSPFRQPRNSAPCTFLYVF